MTAQRVLASAFLGAAMATGAGLALHDGASAATSSPRGCAAEVSPDLAAERLTVALADGRLLALDGARYREVGADGAVTLDRSARSGDCARLSRLAAALARAHPSGRDRLRAAYSSGSVVKVSG